MALKLLKARAFRRPGRRRATRGEAGSSRGVSEMTQARHAALLAAQAELDAYRARYAELYDSAPVGYVTLSEPGQIEEINLTAARLLGFSRRQLLGQPLAVFLARENRREFSNFLSRLRRRPGCHSIQVKLARRPSTPPVFVEVLAISTGGESDSRGSFQCALIDITAWRDAETALRDSEELFRTLASHAPVGIFLTDPEGRVNYVNETWCALTGLSAEESLDRGWLEAVHPEDRRRIETGWHDALRKGVSSAAEFRFLRPDGSVVWVRAQASQLKDAAGHGTGCIATAADITENKRAEAHARRAHNEALAASRAKDDFLAMLSHELRTPLNPVLLLAGDAAHNRDLPPGVRADFDAIRRNIEMEARLIDDLLDITRVTHGKLTLEKQILEVHDVLRNAIAMVENEMARKQIKVKLALKATRQIVTGDPVRLQQVFCNILKNAIKFTPDEGTITVETLTDGAAWKVNITDTGVGIAPGDLENIFDEFCQGSQAGRGGLGLGLAISKKLVELHGGSIRASSLGKNRGSTFAITLPLELSARPPVRPAKTLPPPAPPPAPEKSPVRRSRVLLVEDHEPTRAALTRLLLRRRFEVTGAGSVAEARSFVTEAKPGFDLLISDIGLPDGSGYDLMEELHQEYALQGIALTGYGMEEDVQRSYQAGFATHLTKPVKIESLDNALAAVLWHVTPPD